MDTYFRSKEDLPIWKQFQNKITRYQMYNEEDGLIDKAIRELQTQQVLNYSKIYRL